MSARDDAPLARRRPATVSALAAAVLTLTALAGVVPAGADWDPVPAEAWQEPARPDSGGGDGILLLDRSECRDLQGRFHFEYFGRARVFTPEGRDLGTIDIPYLRGRWKLGGVRARSVLPNGRVTEFDPAQIVESTVFRYGEYEWARATVAVPGVEPGCIVEWGYTLDGPADEYSGWRFDFANRVFTCVSTHTWRSTTWFKEELKRSWRYTGIPSVAVQERCEPDRERAQTVTFTVLHQRGVRDEELAPPAEDATPRVTVFYGGEANSGYWSLWKRIFDDYQDALNKDQGPLEDLVKAMRARHPQPESALAGVYTWIQGHLRSTSEPSWDRRSDMNRRLKSYHWARDINELLGRGEASPLEINCLLVAAARRLGMVAAVGFVGDRRFGAFDSRSRGFPPSDFVTVVNVPGGILVLQPSSRFAPFGSLPWYLRGGDCLLSGRTSDLLRRVSPDLGAPAVARWSLDVRLDPEGALDGRIEARLSAEEGAQWRRDLWEQDPARWPAQLKDRLAEHDGPQAAFESPKLDTPPDSDFVLRATARWPAIASVAGDRIMVPVQKLAPWHTHAAFRPESRKQPVLFRYARDETVHVALHLAPGLSVEELPAPERFENGAGAWSVRWSRAGDGVSVERAVTLARAEYNAQDYPALRELFHALDRADQAVLLVAKQP